MKEMRCSDSHKSIDIAMILRCAVISSAED